MEDTRLPSLYSSRLGDGDGYGFSSIKWIAQLRKCRGKNTLCWI